MMDLAQDNTSSAKLEMSGSEGMSKDITIYARRGVIRDLYAHEPFDHRRIIEPVERFTHTAPRTVLDFSNQEFKIPGIWGKARDCHGSILRHVARGVLFGTSHIIAPDEECSCDTLGYRNNAIDFVLSKTFSHFYKGVRPTINWRSNDVLLDTQSIDLSLKTYIKEPVFLATPAEPDNYGRWLAQVIPKLSYYCTINQRPKILIRAKHQWQRNILNYFNINDSEIIDHDPGRTYYCHEIWSIQHTIADLTISKRDSTTFRFMALDCQRTYSRGSDHTRIFISRRSHSAKHPHYRVLRNEDELATHLRALGFYVVEPESMRFEDQINLFSSAKVVVGLGGAAMFNCLFCNESATIIDIEANDHFTTSHTGMFASRGLTYHLAYGSSEGKAVNSCWSLDVDAFLDGIASIL